MSPTFAHPTACARLLGLTDAAARGSRAARHAPKWPCCLLAAVAAPRPLCTPGTRPGALNPGHPPLPPNPGSKGVLGGSVLNFCFAARISNARSFSNPPRAVSRGCSQLCDPEIVSLGAVLGEAWRVRGASQTLAPLCCSRAKFSPFTRSGRLQSGGSRGSILRRIPWPPAWWGQGRSAPPGRRRRPRACAFGRAPSFQGPVYKSTSSLL